MSSRADDLQRLTDALTEAGALLRRLSALPFDTQRKRGGDLVTDVDRTIDAHLRAALPRNDEAWLSEESADDPARLGARRLWVVDPLDGTREFVAGLPEYCVSVALVEEGRPVAGGVFNPASDEIIVGAEGLGVTINGSPACCGTMQTLDGATVLASRGEFERGQWDGFTNGSFQVRPCGSVAYKMALVAAGRIDATWTLVPKHEWDVAAGVALVLAGGGRVWSPTDEPLTFNRPHPLFSGLAASGPGLHGALRRLLRDRTGDGTGAAPAPHA